MDCIKTGILFSLLTLGTTLLAEAEEKEPITFSEYYKISIASNPSIRASEQRYEAARERITTSTQLPDPKIQIAHFIESIETRTGPQENVLSLSQTIPWLGKLKGRRSFAQNEAQAHYYVYLEKISQTARDLAEHFYEYAYLGKAISLTEDNLALLEKLEATVEVQVKTGSSLSDLLRLQVEKGKLTDKLHTLQENRRQQNAQLQAILNQPSAELLPWPQWNAPPPRSLDETALQNALQLHHPQLSELIYRKLSARARQDLARQQRFPDFTLGVNYFQTDSPLNPQTPGAGDDPWALTLAVNIPLWSSKYSAAQSEALALHQSLEAEHTQRKITLRSQLASNISRHRNAHHRLQLYGEELLQLARQALEINQTNYESGRGTILDVIDSERTLLELELLYWRAAADAHREWVNILTFTRSALHPEQISH